MIGKPAGDTAATAAADTRPPAAPSSSPHTHYTQAGLQQQNTAHCLLLVLWLLHTQKVDIRAHCALINNGLQPQGTSMRPLAMFCVQLLDLCCHINLTNTHVFAKLAPSLTCYNCPHTKLVAPNDIHQCHQNTNTTLINWFTITVNNIYSKY